MNSIEEMCAEENPDVKYDENEAWLGIGVNPAAIPWETLLKNRKAHIEKLRRFNVFKRIHRSHCKSRPLTARWVDKHHKSRWTARGYEQFLEGTEDFYSPTPQHTAVKALLVVAEVKDHIVTFGDCEDAFLQSELVTLGDSDPEVYVEPPEEAEEDTDYVWQLLKVLPGTKAGPVSWTRHFNTACKKLGFDQNLADPCTFHHPKRDMRLVRHVDDVAMEGDVDATDTTLVELKRDLLLKETARLAQVGDEGTFLGTEVKKIEGGYKVRHRPSLFEGAIAEYGLDEANPSPTPGIAHSVELADAEELERDDHRLYRRCTGKLIFGSSHRPDLQFAVGQRAQHGSAPTVGDRKALKKCLRYVQGTKELWLELKPEHKGTLTVGGWSDADWAGCPDRKSMSGGVLTLNGAVIASWSKKQSTVALSSAESELYAMGLTAVEIIAARELLKAWRLHTPTPILRGDASAALAVAARAGPGKMKHLEVRALKIQEWVRDQTLSLKKVGTTHNIADILTKHVTRETLTRLRDALGVR